MASIVSRAQSVRQAVKDSAANGCVSILTGNTLDMLVDSADGRVKRLERIVSEQAAQEGLATLIYSLAAGASAPNVEGPAVRDVPRVASDSEPTLVVDELFEAVCKEENPVLLMVMYAESLLPCEGGSPTSYEASRISEQFVSRATNDAFVKSGNRIMLVECIDAISAAVKTMPGFTLTDVGLPSESERMEAAARWLAHSNKLHLEPGFSVERLARLTGGMTLDDLSRLRMASSAEEPLTIARVKSAKCDIIKRLAGESLEVIEDDRTFDEIADMHNVKQYVEEVSSDGGRASLRMVLAGPPGTGKTSCAAAIANEIDAVPVLLRSPLSKWVGESEKNMANVFRIVESCGRVLLVIDEADQGLLSKRADSASQESSSVYPSLRGMIMERTGDTGALSDLSILLLTNNPSGLDAAVLNRMVVLPVLEASSPQDRASILEINAKRAGIDVEPGAALAAFAQYGDPIDGRRIINILERAQINARRRGASTVSERDLSDALGTTHCTFGKAETLASMHAVRSTVFLDCMPWTAAWRRGVSEYRVPPYLKEFIKDETGAVDYLALESRITALERGASW